MKKIGIFGGTFDPIHFGHISLALQLSEIHHLDEVLFCPTSQSPLKHRPIASAKDRARMIKLAISDISNFHFCKLEIKRKGVSYTVDTLRSLHNRYEKKNGRIQFYLLLSLESLASFPRWKKTNEIMKLCHILVGSRRDHSLTSTNPLIRTILKKGSTPTKLFEISSTEIRDRIKKGRYCGHQVDRRVLCYIKKHQLYI